MAQEQAESSGLNEQTTGRDFLNLTIQIGCALEKLYCSRENDTRKNGEANRNKG